MPQDDSAIEFAFEERPAIRGYPELRWTGKRPYSSTVYYPAQLKESYGEERDGWLNKLYWGDNLQVMSHLLRAFRGKVALIYIDPPFDSKADYKKKIELRSRGLSAASDRSAFEEKQYGDIWANDEYLQFMYERLILMRELLADNGSIYLHCDWHKGHYLRCLMDEVFGAGNFVNEIVWCYTGPGSPHMNQFNRKHDTILWYGKGGDWVFNAADIRVPYKDPNQRPRNAYMSAAGNDFDEESIQKMREKGCVPNDWWEFAVAARFKVDGVRRTGYPTEKPEALLERIIRASSNPGDLVFDCFMGSGTTQAVAMRLGRRFIGADINLGAVQTATKRLLGVARQLEEKGAGEGEGGLCTGFEVYNVNNYDFFRNPEEARELLIAALGIQAFPKGTSPWDGELDGRMAKIMPVNRMATRTDAEAVLSGLPYGEYERRREENPRAPAELVTLVCMGHEPGLKAALAEELGKYGVEVEIRDILRDRSDLQLKRESEADIAREGGKLVIRAFYPMNLLQKLALEKVDVDDWRELVDSVMIDFNYDGAVMQPAVTDIPAKGEVVKGEYDVPEGAGTIRVKITDLISESWEGSV